MKTEKYVDVSSSATQGVSEVGTLYAVFFTANCLPRKGKGVRVTNRKITNFEWFEIVLNMGQESSKKYKKTKKIIICVLLDAGVLIIRVRLLETRHNGFFFTYNNKFVLC